MKRKKRAEKSIESLRERIKEHIVKLDDAKNEWEIERAEYYEKELEALESNLEKKKRILKK